MKLKRFTALLLTFVLMASLLPAATIYAAAASAPAVTIQGTYTYDGTAKTPGLSITDGSYTLREGVDYTVTYSDNIHAGTAYAAVTGLGAYASLLNGKYPFTIQPASVTVTVEDAMCVVGGSLPKFYYLLTSGRLYGSDTLPEPSYSLSAKTGSAAVTECTINAVFPTVRDYTIRVIPGTLRYTDRAFSLENLADVAYDGTAQTPRPVVTGSTGSVLVEGRDYTLSYSNNRSVGTAEIRVTGINNYGATVLNGVSMGAVTATAAFKITKRDLYIKINNAACAYNETPKFSYQLTSGTLAGSDTLSTPTYRLYSRTANTRGITATFPDMPNYTLHLTDGVLTYSGTDTPAPEGSVTVGSIGNVYYNGTEQTPQPTITAENGVTLRQNIDYTLSYSNNRNAGTATVRIEGIGSYAGKLSRTLSFTILPAPVTVTVDDVRCRISNAPNDFSYTITSGKLYGKDTLGEASYEVVSRSGYSYGPVFTIKASFEETNPNYEVTVRNGTMRYTDVDGEGYTEEGDVLSIDKISDVTYDGDYQEPELTVRNKNGYILRENRDYDVTYHNNLHAGTATASVTGLGSYRGEKASRTFRIDKRSIRVYVDDLTVTKGDTYIGSYTTSGDLCRGDSLGKETWTLPSTKQTGSFTIRLSFPTHKDYDITVYPGTLTVLQEGAALSSLGTLRRLAVPNGWENPFSDVSSSAWYYESVRFVNYNGLMYGTGSNRFQPEGETSRAELVTILYRLSGSPTVSYVSRFNDVDPEAYYASAVTWAARNGIANGYGNGCFGPKDSITREQLAAVLYRFAQAYGFSVRHSGDLRSMRDYGQISSYAVEALTWANAKSIITGRTSDAIQPRAAANRAELAAALHHFCTAYTE